VWFMSAFGSPDGSSAFEELSSLNETFSYLNPNDHRLYHEVSPKSNYTYAYSGSYQTELLHRNWRSPNLSRSPLHSPPGNTAGCFAGSPSPFNIAPVSPVSIVGSSSASTASGSVGSSGIGIRERRRFSASTLSLHGSSESDRVLRSRCRAEGGVHCGHVDCRLHGVASLKSTSSGGRRSVRFKLRTADGDTLTAGDAAHEYDDDGSDDEDHQGDRGTVEATLSRQYYEGAQYQPDYAYNSGLSSRTTMSTVRTATTTTTTSRTMLANTKQKIVSGLFTAVAFSANLAKATAQFALAPLVSAISAVKDSVTAVSSSRSAAVSVTRQQHYRNVQRKSSWCFCSSSTLLLLLCLLIFLPLALLTVWWYILPPILAALRNSNGTTAHTSTGVPLDAVGGQQGCCDSKIVANMELRWNQELTEMRSMLNLLAQQRENDEAQRKLLLQRLAQQTNSQVVVGLDSTDENNSTEIERQIAVLRQADADQLQFTSSMSDRISKLEQAHLSLAGKLRQQILSELSGRMDTVTQRVRNEEERSQQKWNEHEQQLTSLKKHADEQAKHIAAAVNQLDTVEKAEKSLSKSVSEQQRAQQDAEKEHLKLAADVREQLGEYENRLSLLQKTLLEQKSLVTDTNNRLVLIEGSTSESAIAEKQQQQTLLDLQRDIGEHKSMILLLQKASSEQKESEALVAKRLDSVEQKSDEERQKLAELLQQQLEKQQKQLTALMNSESKLNKQTSDISERLIAIEKMPPKASSTESVVKPSEGDTIYQTLTVKIQQQLNDNSQEIVSLKEADSEQKKNAASVADRLTAIEKASRENQDKMQQDMQQQMADFQKQLAQLRKDGDEQRESTTSLSGRLTTLESSVESATINESNENKDRSNLMKEFNEQLKQHQNQFELLRQTDSGHQELVTAIAKRLSSLETSMSSATSTRKQDDKSEEGEKISDVIRHQLGELKDQVSQLQQVEAEQRKLTATVSDRLDVVESKLASSSSTQQNDDAVAQQKLISDLQQNLVNYQRQIDLLKQADVQQIETDDSFVKRLIAVEKLVSEVKTGLRNSDSDREKQLLELRNLMETCQKQLSQLQESEIELRKSSVSMSERIESVHLMASSNHENATAERLKLASDLDNQNRLLQQMQLAESEQVTTISGISERLLAIEAVLSSAASLKDGGEDGKRRKAMIDLRQHLSDYQKQLEQLRQAEAEQKKLVEAVQQRLVSVESTLNSFGESKPVNVESAETSQPNSDLTKQNNEISVLQEKLKEYQVQIGAISERLDANEKISENASVEAKSAVALVKQFDSDEMQKELIAEMKNQLSGYEDQLKLLQDKESEKQKFVAKLSEQLTALEAAVSANALSKEAEVKKQEKQKSDLEKQLNAYQLQLALLKDAEAEQRKLSTAVSERLSALETASTLSDEHNSAERSKLAKTFEQQLSGYQEQLLLLKQFSTEQQSVNANVSDRLFALESSITSLGADKESLVEDLVKLKEAEAELRKLATSVSERLATVESTVALLTSSKSQYAADQSKLTVELQDQFSTYQQQLAVLKEAEVEQRKLALTVTKRLDELESSLKTVTKQVKAEDLKQQLEEYQRNLDAKHQIFVSNVSERINAVDASFSAAQENGLGEQQKLTVELQQQLNNYQQQLVLLQQTESDNKQRLFAVESSAASIAGEDEGRRQSIAALQRQVNNIEEQLAQLKDSPPVPGSSCNDTVNETYSAGNVTEAVRLHRQLAEYRRRLVAVERLASSSCNCSIRDFKAEDPFPNLVPDFALHSAGAYVVGTRCTVAYNGQASVVELFGFPVLAFSRSPTTALEPDTNLGECWAFQGFPGHLIVRLAVPARVSSVTIDHAAREVSYNASMSSAPRNFSVYGLESSYTAFTEAVILGSFVYNADTGPASQTFHLNSTTERYWEYVELVVESNHGNEMYTCLYRFRVHGLA
ncbi:hypothetical protein BOX15_Mlig007247g1, partial [Macrostomum lignano]